MKLLSKRSTSKSTSETQLQFNTQLDILQSLIQNNASRQEWRDAGISDIDAAKATYFEAQARLTRAEAARIREQSLEEERSSLEKYISEVNDSDAMQNY